MNNQKNNKSRQSNSESIQRTLKSKRGISRRSFLRLMAYASVELALASVGGGLYVKEIEPSWVEVNEVNIKLPRLSKAFSGLRLVQFSDLHYGGWMNSDRLNHVLDLVASLNPDLIAITGDFVLWHHRKFSLDDQLQYDKLASLLFSLSQRFLTVGVFGNHDYWTRTSAVKEMFQGSGVIDLNNNVHNLKSGGETLSIAGVDDVIYGHDRLNIVQSQLPTEGCSILLVHEPDYADVSASLGRFDLQLSGHSHGGQVKIPFLGPLILPFLGQKYPEGLYRVGDMLQYTNRGVGMKRPFIRFNCRPEITVFTLESA